ncbi:MAG TPA: hypothetical protein VKS22_01325 [Candidatus Binataceae bacterium]|nr:hypothetical protein [Candidatus Binataceae bacterium]
MAAYLDTNVFDHLYKKVGCSGADIANLRKKIYGRELSIPLSIHTLEEILLDRRARPELLVAKIKLTLSLANFRRMVKPCDQLLSDDIRAYAATGEAALPFIDANLQNIISDGLTELIETDGEELDEDLIAALEETRRQKEHFRDGIRMHRAENQEAAASIAGQVTFDEYFDLMAPSAARSFAERAGALAECENRGLEGLLNIRSVRMSVGASLSFIYAWSFEELSPNIGDSKDLLHAASAAAVAETFVTDDATLRRIVARVPLDGFEALDLPAFLQRVT